MLNPQYGLINAWGQKFLGWDAGIPFLSQDSTALATVIVFEIWRYFPFAFLFITARLSALSGEIEEAARVDGATPGRRFRFVILPQLIPVMSVLFVLRFIFTFNKFDDVYLLTGGGSGTEVVGHPRLRLPHLPGRPRHVGRPGPRAGRDARDLDDHLPESQQAR